MKILFIFGIPDNQIGQINLQQINAGISLPGNTPIMQSLVEPLLARGWQAQFAYLGQPTQLNIEGVDAIINCICDASIQRRSLAMLQELVAKTGLRVINTPAAISACTRDGIRPDMFQGMTIPLTTSYNSKYSNLDEHLKKHGHQLPVLIRPMGMHSGTGMQRIENVAEFVADGVESDYFVTDFVNFISLDGLYRKYRLVYAAGQVFPHHLFIGEGWSLHLKDVRELMEQSPALMKEANRYINTMPDEEAERLMAIFAHLGLDFGMVDYTRDPEGRPVIFEVNPCFLLAGVNQPVIEAIRGGATDPSPDIVGAVLGAIESKPA